MTKTRAAGRKNDGGQISHDPHSSVVCPHHRNRRSGPPALIQFGTQQTTPQFPHAGEFLTIERPFLANCPISRQFFDALHMQARDR